MRLAAVMIIIVAIAIIQIPIAVLITIVINTIKDEKNLKQEKRWLREVKSFDIIIGTCKHDFGDGNEKAYFYDCYYTQENENAQEYFEDIYYHFYEQALEAAIKECLTIILEGK